MGKSTKKSKTSSSNHALTWAISPSVFSSYPDFLYLILAWTRKQMGCMHSSSFVAFNPMQKCTFDTGAQIQSSHNNKNHCHPETESSFKQIYCIDEHKAQMVFIKCTDWYLNYKISFLTICKNQRKWSCRFNVFLFRQKNEEKNLTSLILIQ